MSEDPKEHWPPDPTPDELVENLVGYVAVAMGVSKEEAAAILQDAASSLPDSHPLPRA